MDLPGKVHCLKLSAQLK